MKISKKAGSKVEKNVKVYNEKLELVSKSFAYEFTPVSIAENVEPAAKVEALSGAVSSAMSRVLTGAGEKELTRVLGALNKVGEFFASRTARTEALQGSISKKAVSAMIAAFSQIPPYSAIAEKNARKNAILAAIRSNEALLATLSAAVTDDSDEDEDDSAE